MKFRTKIAKYFFQELIFIPPGKEARGLGDQAAEETKSKRERERERERERASLCFVGERTEEMKTFLRFFFSTSTFSKRIKHLLFYTISLLQAKSTTKNTPRDSTSDSELRALPLKTSERSRPTGTTESRSDFQRGFGSSSSKPEPMSSSVKEGPTAATSVPKSSELISSRAPLKSPFRCSLSTQPARTKGRIPLLRRAHHDIGLHSKVYLERLVQRARIPRAVELSPLLADLFFRSVALCRRKRRGRKKVQRRKKKKSDFSPTFFFLSTAFSAVSFSFFVSSVHFQLSSSRTSRSRSVLSRTP